MASDYKSVKVYSKVLTAPDESHREAVKKAFQRNAVKTRGGTKLQVTITQKRGGRKTKQVAEWDLNKLRLGPYVNQITHKGVLEKKVNAIKGPDKVPTRKVVK